MPSRGSAAEQGGSVDGLGADGAYGARRCAGPAARAVHGAGDATEWAADCLVRDERDCIDPVASGDRDGPSGCDPDRHARVRIRMAANGERDPTEAPVCAGDGAHDVHDGRECLWRDGGRHAVARRAVHE